MGGLNDGSRNANGGRRGRLLLATAMLRGNILQHETTAVIRNLIAMLCKVQRKSKEERSVEVDGNK